MFCNVIINCIIQCDYISTDNNIVNFPTGWSVAILKVVSVFVGLWLDDSRTTVSAHKDDLYMYYI